MSEAPPAPDEPKAPSSRAPGSLGSRGTRASWTPEWLDSETSVTRPTETSLPAHTAVAQRDCAILTVLTGLNAGQVFTIDEDEITIGRGRDVKVRIDDVGISRAHTRIVRTLEGKFVMEDLQSTNGTFVGGRRVDRADLQGGDRIQIGPNVVLRFAILDEAEEQLAHQLYEASTKDALTKCFNRKYFVERLAAEVAYSHRHKSPLSIVLFDLDHFKKVNDTWGHLAGDVVLRVVAAQVQRTIRTEDVLARYGGEEFVCSSAASPRELGPVRRAGAKGGRAAARSLGADRDAATISVGVGSLSELRRGRGTGDASSTSPTSASTSEGDRAKPRRLELTSHRPGRREVIPSGARESPTRKRASVAITGGAPAPTHVLGR